MKRRAWLMGWGVLVGACAHTPSTVKQATPTRVVAAQKPQPKHPVLDGNSRRLIEAGFERYRHSDFAGAIQQWEPVWLLSESLGGNWTPSLLYYCYLATGQYDKGLALAEQTIQEQPHNPLGYQQKGMAQLWRGKSAEAEDALRRAVEFESRSPEAYFYLGIALSRQDKKSDALWAFDQAEKEYVSILKSNPADFPANYGLAYSYLYQDKKIEDAFRLITAARESLKVNPDVELTPDKNLYQGFYLPLLEGIYWNRHNQPKESLDHLVAALRSSPSGARADLAEVYYFMGTALRMLGENKAAKTFLAESLEMDPNGPYTPVKEKND